MAYVIALPCIGVKDGACVSVCPADCIHPRPDEGGFAEHEQLYIDPTFCVDCDLCVAECPVAAQMFPSTICRGMAALPGEERRPLPQVGPLAPARRRINQRPCSPIPTPSSTPCTIAATHPRCRPDPAGRGYPTPSVADRRRHDLSDRHGSSSRCSRTSAASGQDHAAGADRRGHRGRARRGRGQGLPRRRRAKRTRQIR